MDESFRYRGIVYVSFLLITLLTFFDDAGTTSFDYLSTPWLDMTASVITFSAPACEGFSLLQASSQRSLWTSPAQENVTFSSAPSDVIVIAGRWQTNLMLLVLSVVACCLAFSLPCLSNFASRLHRDDSSVSDRGDLITTHDSEYGEVHEDESDAGDWQVDDLVPDLFQGISARSVGQDVPAAEEDMKDRVTKKIEETYSSGKLLKSIVVALAEFWGALAIMYWSLLNNDKDIMDCKTYRDKESHNVFVSHACRYTLACLRGFPILAANMILVLMIRVLVQTRLYYSLLKEQRCLDFANIPFMHTIWPWACGFSMFQGALHFVLKCYLDTGFDFAHVGFDIEMYLRLLRKFVLPGLIFFSFLGRYADIENVLVPFNRLVELDYTDGTENQRHCIWLTNIFAMNERVLAFDARHRDVIGAAYVEVGKAPTIQDVIKNIIEHYDKSHETWSKRKHRSWGLFRSMWPSALLLDRRLDWQDSDTRAWLIAFVILVIGCALASCISIIVFFTYGGVFSLIRMVFSGKIERVDTETMLDHVVLVCHGLLILSFLHRAARNMHYHAVRSSQFGNVI